MDYRKAMNNKRKVEETLTSLKNLAKENVEKVQKFAGTKTSDIVEAVKTETEDFATNIKKEVKNKLEVEFRKHYGAYAISYIDSLLVNTFMENKSFTISMGDENYFTLLKLVDEIALDMVSDEVLARYKTDAAIKNLYDFLVMYYEGETQLSVENCGTYFTLTLVVTDEDVENKSTEETIED